MPYLQWNGKKEVENYDESVPITILQEDVRLSINPGANPDNLIIQGDNAEVMKSLLPRYQEKIKCIYIDPPYNTGNEKWIYNDRVNSPEIVTWLNRVVNSRELSRHDRWLCMMYPRLKLMRNLLRADGFIFVSIGNDEVHHLRLIMDEIFGEENHVNILAVKRATKNINNQFARLKTLNQAFEYILVYRKSGEADWVYPYAESSPRRKDGYWTGFWSNADRPTMRYELLGVTPPRGQWKWVREKALEAVQNYKEYQEQHALRHTLREYWELSGKKKRFIRRVGSGNPQYWVEPSNTRLLDTNWMDLYVNDHRVKQYFDTPKSVKLLKRIILSTTREEDMVLDCFAGSGTTAQAVTELNHELPGSNRKFILVEINGYAEEIITQRIASAVNGEIGEGFRFLKVQEPDGTGATCGQE